MRTQEVILRLLLLACGPVAFAQDAAAPVPGAPPAAQGASLQAIVMDVQGKARWRPSAEAEWRDAKVNDIVDPGTEIRTGLKGNLTLRVGKNATVLVDSGTEFHIPSIVQDGETLRTLATVKSGRVDFKVDKVGFSNDFKVVTPATTLSVRGTGFSLATGPLAGVEVTGVRTNMINAIEVKYVASNATYFMSGAAQTSSQRQDPVQSAWVSTVGPPPVVGTLADKGQLSQQVSQGQSGNAPTNTQSSQQVAGAKLNGQGGNSLIIAAQSPAASEAMRQLAIDVTGNTQAVAPPVDPVTVARRQMLANERDFVVREAPKVLLDLNDPSRPSAGLDGAVRSINATLAVTEEQAALGFASSFEAVYYSPDLGGEELARRARMIEEDRWDLDKYTTIFLAQPDTSSFMQMADDPVYAPDPSKPQVHERLAPQVARAERWAERTRGHGVFEKPDDRFDAPSPVLVEAGTLVATDAVPNAVRWLENAQTWSMGDRADSDGWVGQVAENLASPGSWNKAVDSLDKLRSNAEFWRVARTTGDGDPSPSMIALKVNESVQRSWDSVVTNVLGSDVGRLHDDLSHGMAHMIEALERRDFTGIQMGIDTYAKAFEIAANQEGSAASQKALQEFAAAVVPVQEAVDASLRDAYDAARQAHEARSLSQRAFLFAASNLQLRRAAEIANRCQEATLGQNGIIPNAAAMQDAYVYANRAALATGAVRPELARERASTRP